MTGAMRTTLVAGDVIERKGPRPPVDWAVADSPELRALVRRMVAKALAVHDQHAPQPSTDHPRSQGGEERLADLVHAVLLDPRPPRVEPLPELQWLPVYEAARFPAMTPAGLLKLMLVTDRITAADSSYSVLRSFNTRYRATGHPTLLEIATLLDECGYDGGAVVTAAYLGAVLGQGWADDAVWPFFARHLDSLFAYVARRARNKLVVRRFCEALNTFPTLPNRAVDKLYELALGPRKTARPLAWTLLQRHPERIDRAVAALADPDRHRRRVAAEWLGSMNDPAGVPALERALSRERAKSVRDAILVALRALGQPAERFLTPDELNHLAAKASTIEIPEALAWFPWDALPEVRWARTSEPVPPRTLTWLIVEAVKRGSPNPAPLWAVYCRTFRDDDQERLGRFLLEAWIAEDLRPLPETEAFERARRQALTLHSRMSSNPTWYAHHPLFGKTVEELTAHYLADIVREPAGSAYDSKGLLGMVAACAGPDVVPLVGHYLTRWHTRDLECEALLEMLGGMDHPATMRLLFLSITKLRSRLLRRRARRLAEQAAARRGWTLAELADRTAPTAGFDENGQLALSYGPRVFTASLTSELTIQLRDPDGTTIRQLPRRRASDDPAHVEAARAALSAARKELPSIVKEQTARLYEAMCIGRTWRLDEWRTYLAGHPVLRHLVRRLVWTASWGEPARMVSFRPLEDGSFTDATDNEVTLPEGSMLRIAHDVILSPDDVATWTAHLRDYEVAPLLSQFGKPVFRLVPERRDDRELTDFQGYQLARLELRGRAAKLGYTGGSRNGGSSYEYRKPFPTLGIAIVFRGEGDSSLPREEQVVTLTQLLFKPLSPGKPTLRLGEVPEVLLSEAWNDVRLIATGGTSESVASASYHAPPRNGTKRLEETW